VRQSQVDKSEFSLKSVVFLLWGAGVVYCLMRTAQRWRAIIRLRRQSEPVQSIAWLCDLRDEADRMAIRRLPQLRIAPHANTVQLVGIRSPAIVLPAGSLETFGGEERRLILAHELAHLKRRDLTWNWLPTVARSLFFFHPLVWAMVRGWCQAQESACNELVIQCQANRRASYGRLLLKMSTRWPDERRNVLVAAGISGAYRHLEQRILAMTQVQPHSTPKLVAAAAAAVLIIASGVIPCRLVAQEPARPAPRSNQGTIAQTQTGAATMISFSGSFSSSSDGSSLPSSTSAIVLPGKLYLRAGVEYKTTNGATGKYSGIMAVDPNSGEWERLDVGGFAVRVSPQNDRMAFCQFSGAPRTDVVTPSNLFVADFGGKHSVKVADNAGFGLWSPEGKRLLFNRVKYTKDDHSEGSVWLYNRSRIASRPSAAAVVRHASGRDPRATHHSGKRPQLLSSFSAGDKSGRLPSSGPRLRQPLARQPTSKSY
jgi:beta-lactamase regulating signal transducer with metallopeptidase domain